MKALVILIFLVSTDAISQFTAKNKAKCLEELKITNEELKVMKKSKETEPKEKCFYSCIMEKNHLIANDKIIPGAFKKLLGPRLSAKKVEQVQSLCHREMPVKDKCDFGHAIFKCYNSQIKNDLLLWRQKIETTTKNIHNKISKIKTTTTKKATTTKN